MSGLHSCPQTSSTTITGSGELGNNVEIANAALIVRMSDRATTTSGTLTIQSTGELALTNVYTLGNALSVGSIFYIYTGKVSTYASALRGLLCEAV